MLDKFTEDLAIIQKLGTFPNQEQSLQPDEMKAKFDQAALAIQKYINQYLIPEIDRVIATNQLNEERVAEAQWLAANAKSVADHAFEIAGIAKTDATQATMAATHALEELGKIQNTIRSYVKTVSGHSPDQNGDITLPYLQIDFRKLMGFDTIVYNGSNPRQKDVGATFRFIEPSEYNPIPNNLNAYLSDMPAVLNGTFKATENAQDEYNFKFAYAFSGGYSNSDNRITACVVIEPATGKIYRFDFADAGCTVTTSTIGESGGGAIQPLTFTGAVEATYDGTEPVEIPIPSGGGGGDVDELLIDFTTEEEVQQIDIPLTGISEKIRNAKTLIFHINIPGLPSADTATDSANVEAAFWRTWNMATIFNGNIAPSNQMSYKAPGWGYSVVERTFKGLNPAIITQIARTKNNSICSFTDHHHLYDYRDNTLSDSATLRVTSAIPLCIGTRIRLWVKGELKE